MQRAKSGMWREMWEYWGLPGDFVEGKRVFGGRDGNKREVVEKHGGAVFVCKLITEKRICKNETLTPLLSCESN